MARQPFLPTYKDDKTAAMGAQLIESLPKVAELVGRIAINWSGVELNLSLTLGCLLGVQNAAAVAVFLSIKNSRAQREALQAAAEKILTGEVRNLFDVILSLHSRLDKQRNEVVHCVWGKSEATPDGIIWSSTQDYANYLINAYHKVETGQTIEGHTDMLKSCFVFSYQDLEKLNKEIMAFETVVRNFHVYIRYQDKSAGPTAYRDLLAEPMIQRELRQRL